MGLKVAVVGAGISGLAAARGLQEQGISPVVFEKSRAVGGRASTRRVGEFTFDSGAQSISPRDSALAKLITEQLPHDDLMLVDRPTYIHEGLRVMRGDPARNATPRYCYRNGMNTLGKLMAQGLEVRFEHSVQHIEKNGLGYSIEGEKFDGVILTAPIPQSSLIMWGLGEQRPVANSRYRSCLSVLLGYHTPPPDVPYCALIESRGLHPLQWLGLESLKAPNRAPEGGSAFIGQMSALYSRENWTQADDKLVESVADYLTQLYGERFRTPAVAEVKRWKYSQPEEIVLFETANRGGSRLIVAGDGTEGGRLEYAYESGIKAVAALVAQFK